MSTFSHRRKVDIISTRIQRKIFDVDPMLLSQLYIYVETDYHFWIIFQRSFNVTGRKFQRNFNVDLTLNQRSVPAGLIQAGALPAKTTENNDFASRAKRLNPSESASRQNHWK